MDKNRIQHFIVQGIPYQTPPVPALKTIRGYNLKKADQVWSRREEDQQWHWNIDPKQGPIWSDNASDEQLEWFDEEIARIHNGDWIMINGEPVWFNKYAYLFHQHFLLQEGFYPEFRDTSLEFFRFYELVDNDRFCLGTCGVKGRRLGLSSMAACILLLHMLIEKNIKQGITSKTGDDAEEMYIFVKNGMENLPNYLKPEVRKITETELHLATPAPRISSNNRILSSDKGLNNRTNWKAPSENVYDSQRERALVLDESAKYERVNVKKLLKKISETLVVGASVIGKILMFSTVNAGDKGGDNFKEIFMDSDPNGKLDKYGRTTTKLKRFFIPGYRGVLGYIDKYGNSVVDTPTPEQTAFLKTVLDPSTGQLACPDPYIGAKEFRQITRDMLVNDKEALQEEKRLYPFEWKEVFENANNKCHFNNQPEIEEQIDHVETMLKMNPKMYRRGWFKKLEDGPVVFRDDPEGLWYILELLEPRDANKYVYKYGQKTPANTMYGTAGVDTFANSESTAEEGSDACMVIHKRYNALDEENSGMPVALYLGRPKNKTSFNKQIFWACEYYGIKMLVERMPTDWYDYALANELLNYCIKTKRSIDGTDVYGVSPQNQQLREQHLTEMVEYVDVAVAKILFLPILKTLIPFNVKDRLKYDALMGWGYALMAGKEKGRSIAPPKKDKQVIRTFNLKHRHSA